MYQPISFNVIRQACAWHAFPQPALRMLSFSDTLPDVVVAEYRAAWNEWDIPQAYFIPDPVLPFSGLYRFISALQSCFCEDVEVRHCEWDDQAQEMRCILYVKVDKALLAWVTEINQ